MGVFQIFKIAQMVPNRATHHICMNISQIKRNHNFKNFLTVEVHIQSKECYNIQKTLTNILNK